MCTYVTNTVPVEGSGKAADSWHAVTDAVVYYDHPQHAMAEHTLNIDFRIKDSRSAQRVAVELTAESAVSLIEAIRSTLAEVDDLV